MSFYESKTQAGGRGGALATQTDVPLQSLGTFIPLGEETKPTAHSKPSFLQTLHTGRCSTRAQRSGISRVREEIVRPTTPSWSTPHEHPCCRRHTNTSEQPLPSCSQVISTRIQSQPSWQIVVLVRGAGRRDEEGTEGIVPKPWQALTILADGITNRGSAGHRGDTGELWDNCGCTLLLCPCAKAQPAILCPAQTVGFT